MDEIYRFRRVENLLGKHQELERQEIYFASPDQLNDPMEGYRDIYWKGDAIVWENFLINYLRCVSQIFSLYLVVGESKKLENSDIPLHPYGMASETPQSEKLFADVKKAFFSNTYIKKLPAVFAKQEDPIRRRELLPYLAFVQHYAINSVSDTYFRAGLSRERMFYHQVVEVEKAVAKIFSIPRLVNRLGRQNPNIEGLAGKLYGIVDQIRKKHIQAVKYTEMTEEQLNSNKNFLLMDLPERFLDKLETLMYPNWYSASFLGNCTNSAIWGHYAENHQGICLIFSPGIFEDKPCLNLNTEYGYNNAGAMVGMRPHILRQMEYHNKHVEIDFFRSLGKSPTFQLNHMWYKNSKGQMSICGEHLNEKKDEWHNRYWDNFYKAATVKLDEWKYEEEYRLIINDILFEYSDPAKRKLAYDFNELKGLIFGMKTSIRDKKAIIRIIKEKCEKEGRKNFEFYEAYYDQMTGKIERLKLEIL